MPVVTDQARRSVLARLRSARDLRVRSEAQERAGVIEARELGISWEEIAKALGRNRASVWEKYHNAI
jgi:hypothetical protein